MDKYEHIRNQAPEIFIENSLTFLKTLYERKAVKILSPFPTINNIACDIRKGQRCFEITTAEFNPFSNPVQYQSVGYGYRNPFTLVNNESKFEIKNGAGYVSLKPAQGFKMEGKLWEMESN